MNDTLEKTPGVYVRSNEHAPAHELDMLWSGTRTSHFREERSAVLFFCFGLIVGILLTAAVAFFFFIKPSIKTGDNLLTVPVREEGQATSAQVDKEPAGITHITQPIEAPVSNKPDAATISTPTEQTAPGSTRPVQTTTTATPVAGAGHHVVKNGDTLGSIAYKYYGSSAPDFVEKITRANGMKNPNSLKLDQDLVIPPKNY